MLVKNISHVMLYLKLSLLWLMLGGFFYCSESDSEDENVDSLHSPTSLEGVRKEVQDFVDAFNYHRELNDLSKLNWDEDLYLVALEHSKNMLRLQTLAHRLEGRGVATRVRDAGIAYTKVAENIASQSVSGGEVLEAWLNSPSHRQNIDDPDFTHHAVSYVNDDTQHYWTHVFIQKP